MERTQKIFDADLTSLKDGLLLMGGLVESMLREAEEALSNHNVSLAIEVIRRDQEIDQVEKDVDELAVQILALRQPAATDLRFVTSALKISKDLERMGDEIKNICERVQEMPRAPEESLCADVYLMIRKAQYIIKKSLDSFVHLSSQEAGRVLDLDEEIDYLHLKIRRDMTELMKVDSHQVDLASKLISVSKSLERIGDHAINVAEQVIFTVEGLDIRHEDRPTPLP